MTLTSSNERITRALWQIPALMILAALIAVAVNQIRPDGLALIEDWSIESRFNAAAGGNLVIDLVQAERLFGQHAAVFVDARPPDQYRSGHIQHALNIPWPEVDPLFTQAADRLADAEMIITYCDGEACSLSHELALFLKEMAFENVRVLVNGWTVWQQAGLPIANGE